MRPLEIAGQRFGRLRAIEPTHQEDGRRVWRCECDCGAEHLADASALVRGRVRSCGCLFRDMVTRRNTKHGMTETRTYTSWCHMKARCENPANAKFEHYGGRGIRVCDRWASDFQAFLDDMGEVPEGRTIDRIDVNGDYEPGNCRWATPEQQSNNRRRNMWVLVGGERMTLARAARSLGISYWAARSRIKRGKPVDQTEVTT